jgi:hypothetical protein
MTSIPPPRPPFRKQFSQPVQSGVIQRQRPGCLTAVCLFLVFASLVWVLLAAIYQGERGRWYPAHLVLQALAVAAAALGLWRMQKWGALLLAAVAALIHVLYFFTGLANLETFLLYAVAVGPAFYFYGRMK